jgi:hypothetical protein
MNPGAKFRAQSAEQGLPLRGERIREVNAGLRGRSQPLDGIAFQAYDPIRVMLCGKLVQPLRTEELHWNAWAFTGMNGMQKPAAAVEKDQSGAAYAPGRVQQFHDPLILIRRYIYDFHIA